MSRGGKEKKKTPISGYQKLQEENPIDMTDDDRSTGIKGAHSSDITSSTEPVKPANVFFSRSNLFEQQKKKAKEEKARILRLLSSARGTSEEKMKEIYREASENILFRAWNKGPLKPFCLWLIWLFVGTMFYGSYNFNGNFARGFYYSVNVGYSIGWGVLHDKSTGCKAFSILYILVGAVFVSRWLAYLLENAVQETESNAYENYVLRRNLRRNNPFRKVSPFLSEAYVFLAMNSSRLLVIYLWLMYVFIGAAWSCAAIDWPIIDGVYFAVSSMSTGGLWGIPVDSPDQDFVFVGMFGATGVPLMGMAMADLAALIVALRSQTQVGLFANVGLNQQEKLLLDIFRNDPERGYIEKNEFLLFHLVKRKLVPLQAIREIYEEFERLDVNSAGVLTYRDLQTDFERQSSLESERGEETVNPILIPDDRIEDDLVL